VETSFSRQHNLRPRSLYVLVLVFILYFPPPTSSQPESALTVDRITGKLWRVIDVKRVYAPQFKAHAILEAPDGDRLSLTFRTANTQIFVLDDVIEFILKTQSTGAIPQGQWEDYLIPHRVKLGKTRWWKERLKQEGKTLQKEFRLFLEQQKGEDREI
jgi:hypothetical protein